MTQGKNLLDTDNYNDWINNSKKINQYVDTLEYELKDYISYKLKELNIESSLGLVPNEIRNDKKYKELKVKFDSAFKKLQEFNKASPKKYKQKRYNDYLLSKQIDKNA